MWETQFRALGWEDPLEKEMAIHSSTIAWKIPQTEEPGRYSLWGHKESDMTEQLHFHFTFTLQTKRFGLVELMVEKELGRESMFA